MGVLKCPRGFQCVAKFEDQEGSLVQPELRITPEEQGNSCVWPSLRQAFDIHLHLRNSLRDRNSEEIEAGYRDQIACQTSQS